MNWRPLLDSDHAAAARDAVYEIADTLDADAGTASLASGAAGRVVLFGYLDDIWPERDFAARAERQLDAAIDRVACDVMTEGLFDGIAGIAWAVEHRCGSSARPDEEDTNADVDRFLVEHVGATPWRGDYDLVSGLVGVGVYALERARHPSGRELLAAVVARLDELPESRAIGATWPTRPGRMPAEQRAMFPAGRDDLGVAHGAPAVAVVLAGAVRADVERARARRLLDAAVAWLLAQRRDGAASAFAYHVASGLAWEPARSAWCYGDPGIATALLATARAVGERGWEREAIAIASRAAARPDGDCGVTDAGLCHGAAGLGHLYNRLWHATDEATFADAARRWFARALELRGRDASLLEGECGVALALAAASCAVEPVWDRALAVSLA
jgi:hypothetical protein